MAGDGMSAVASIIIGALVLTGVFAAGVHAMSRTIGWKITLQIWAATAAITATIVGATLLIGYGVEHL